MSVLHCQGFLEALALLNSEASDLCASYELQRLPDAPDLATALGLRVEHYALLAAFIESIDDALGGFSLHAVTMTPPSGFWYAICCTFRTATDRLR